MAFSDDQTERFDAIVVGAGIAGMMAATELNAKGHRVLVLEHNHQPGGLMSGIWRKGFYFDVGCQSFENMGMVFPLLERYGLSEVARFHRTYYRLHMPGIDLVVRSLRQAREEFKRAFPESAEGFDRVFDWHDEVSSFCRRVFVPELIPYVSNDGRLRDFAAWGARAMPWAPKLKTLLYDDFEDWYKRLLPASGARDLLSRCGYTRMNVFVASAFWHLWADDYWYPEGGYQKWFDRWKEALESRGVYFRFKSTVTALERKDNQVSAVLTKKGERFSAREIVYSGDYQRLVRDLVGREAFPSSVVKRLDEAKHSDPLISVYLGLNFPREELRKILKSSHIFYFPNKSCTTALDLADPEAHQKAFLEVTAHCLEDPSLAPEGKSAVVLQAFTRCEWNAHWLSRGAHEERTLEYRALKRKVLDELVGVFEGLFPDVRKYIEYSDLGSPLTTVRFTRNTLGGSCGFELNWRNYPFANPLGHSTTPIKNLHAAGHFTVWPGAVPTAALSGRVAGLAAAKRLSVVQRGRSKSRGFARENEARA